MNASKAEDEGREQLAATDAELDSAPAIGQSRTATLTTLIVGIFLAVAGAWISANLADRFRVIENVEHGASSRRGTRLVIGNVTQNAAVAYALVGATLSLILGVTGGCLLGRFSMRRVLTAGFAGIVLGASFGAASSYGLTPLYFNRLETADVTRTILIHLGIWTAVGSRIGYRFWHRRWKSKPVSGVIHRRNYLALPWQPCCSMSVEFSSRSPIRKRHFPKRPVRDWRRTSFCVYAWRPGSWLSHPRNLASHPTRLDADAWLTNRGMTRGK